MHAVSLCSLSRIAKWSKLPVRMGFSGTNVNAPKVVISCERFIMLLTSRGIIPKSQHEEESACCDAMPRSTMANNAATRNA